MRTTKVSRTQTITKMVSKIGIKIDSHIRAGNMGCPGAVVKSEVWERRNGQWAMGRNGDLVKKSLRDKFRASDLAFAGCRFAVWPLRLSLLTNHFSPLTFSASVVGHATSAFASNFYGGNRDGWTVEVPGRKETGCGR